MATNRIGRRKRQKKNKRRNQLKKAIRELAKGMMYGSDLPVWERWALHINNGPSN